MQKISSTIFMYTKIVEFVFKTLWYEMWQNHFESFVFHQKTWIIDLITIQIKISWKFQLSGNNQDPVFPLFKNRRLAFWIRLSFKVNYNESTLSDPKWPFLSKNSKRIFKRSNSISIHNQYTFYPIFLVTCPLIQLLSK